MDLYVSFHDGVQCPATYVNSYLIVYHWELTWSQLSDLHYREIHHYRTDAIRNHGINILEGSSHVASGKTNISTDDQTWVEDREMTPLEVIMTITRVPGVNPYYIEHATPAHTYFSLASLLPRLAPGWFFETRRTRIRRLLNKSPRPLQKM
jgi:hypothetical protein